MLSRSLLHILLFLPVAINSKAQAPAGLPIELQHCSISVTANMFTAATTLAMEFYNPNDKVLDGEYSFSLQQGQQVTGFALDINGHLREGVIVDKQQGRIAYENTIRRRIDPGLLEMTAGNNYRVRIYPMPAKGTRKIRINISELLLIKANALQYYLPLDVSYPVKELKIQCIVSQSPAMPLTTEGLLKGKRFKEQYNSFSIQDSATNVQLKQPLSFQVPLQQANSVINYSTGSTTAFALHIPTPQDFTPAQHIRSIAVFWDVSSSAVHREIKKEIDFLERYIREKAISNITIITFSNAVHETRNINISSNNFNELKDYLEEQEFDGGTQLGSLDCDQYKCSQYLLFSDGLSNFGSGKIKPGRQPLFCINSSTTANHSLLKKISLSSGGNYIDLSRTEIIPAIKEMEHGSLQLLSVKQSGTDLPVDSLLPFQSNSWLTLTGKLKNITDDIDVVFGKLGKVIKNEKIVLSAKTGDTIVPVDTAVFLKQYNDLQTTGAAADVINAFAKQHHMVSPGSSFIVLDNINDYIQYGIVPPAELQQEYEKNIYAVKQKEEELKMALANEEINNLQTAAVLYNERISWWDAKEPLINLQDAVIKKEIPITLNDRKKEEKTEVAAVFKDQHNNGQKFNGVGELNEVVVTGYQRINRKNFTGSAVTIRTDDIKQGGVTDVSRMLEGRVAGVSVQNVSSTFGSAPKIRIRGATSLSGDNKPLWVVDGIVLEDIVNISNEQLSSGDPNTLLGSSVAGINSNDIETVDILKDAAATALYGARAMNGVVVITTKRGTRSIVAGTTKYKDLDDMDYITELREMDKDEAYDGYLAMKSNFSKQESFYFDVAQLFFDRGDKKNALRILSNIVEIDNENHQLLKAVGYILEQWKLYPEAIDVYKKVLTIKEEEPQSYRDLALAYEAYGDHQAAVDLLYKVIIKNFYQYEDRYRGIKSLMLNEMNAIISRNSNSVTLCKINNAIIKPLPVDIRIVIDWNKDETDVDLHIEEPGKEECFYGHRHTKKGGRLSEDFTQGYGPEEYEIRNAQNGTYTIRVNYFGDRYQKKQTPTFLKLTVYKNFGKPDQTAYTQSIIMDNQSGKIEIDEIKF